jgi:hypothetical protein
MIAILSITYIPGASGRPGVTRTLKGVFECSGEVGTECAKERTESCGRTSRNSKACLSDRPDRDVSGGVEEVGAPFKVMKGGNADDSEG